jgi:hypothetical protein
LVVENLHEKFEESLQIKRLLAYEVPINLFNFTRRIFLSNNMLAKLQILILGHHNPVKMLKVFNFNVFHEHLFAILLLLVERRL